MFYLPPMTVARAAAAATAALKPSAASHLSALRCRCHYSSHLSPLHSPRRLALLSSLTACTPLPPAAAWLSRPAADRRTYAVDANHHANTIQGTIGKGAAGAVDEEAQRVTERLRTPEHLNEKEKMIFEKLEGALKPLRLEVQDISGGCGSMYGIEIVSERFRGQSLLKQQRLVNEVLGEEIKGWHGVQLKTRVP